MPPRTTARPLGLDGGPHTGLGTRRPAVDAFEFDKRRRRSEREEVENTQACPRYTGVTVRGVTVKGVAPSGLKDALSTIGLRPINSIVDITNYLLHGIGQPLHCFDVARFWRGHGQKRPRGEKFVTLDGWNRS